MKKTLVFRTPSPLSQRTLVWDVSEKSSRDRAYVDLFQILDSELDSYRQPDSVVCALLDLARNGNPEACEALLCYRRNRAGEQFEEVEVRSGPTEPVLREVPEKKARTVSMAWAGETAIESLETCPLPPIEEIERASSMKVENCEDCGVHQNVKNLIVKGDHHGGKKRVCADRDACHQRSPG